MDILLWEKREEKGLSTRKLSELSGISRTMINRIENRKVSPRINDLEKLAIALGCEITDLLKK